MSWRRFGVVLWHLPAESEFKTALRDSVDVDWDDLPEPQGDGVWSRTDLLLAKAADQIAFLRWEQSDRSMPPPEPTPRPGVRPASKVVAISPSVEAYLHEKARLHGAAPSLEWMREHGLA